MTQNQLGEYIKGAVFPQNVEHPDGNVTCLGLTKREYFAAMAMQGLLAAHNIYETGVDHDVNSMHSLLAADALIKALNEPQP